MMLAIFALMAGSLVLLDAPTPIRLPVVLGFLGMGPGLSIINLFAIEDITQKLVLSLGLSIALDTIVAGLVLYAGLWSPSGIMLVLVGITLAGAGIQVRFTPEALGFVTPAGAEPTSAMDPEQAGLSAPEQSEAPVAANAIPRIAAKDNEEPSNIPVAVCSHYVSTPTNAEIEPTLRPGRLARAMLFIGLVGGCIMLIARTSRRSL